MEKKALAAFFVAMFLFSASAMAKKPQPRFEANVSGGYLDGDTTYEIGGRYDASSESGQFGFPISRLEFPFNLAVVTAEGIYRPGKSWRLSLTGLKNVSNTSDTMKDSDWEFGNFGDPALKDIYSQSKVDPDIYTIDAKARYTLITTEEANVELGYTGDEPDVWYTFFVGLGYRYESYHYDVNDLQQWYPTEPWVPIVQVSGLVLKYDLDFDIPYGELGFDFWWTERFRMEFSTAFSIFVRGTDKDQHLLRDRVTSLSSGWNGKYLTGTVRAQYFFCENWIVDAAITGSRINVDGVAYGNQPDLGPFTIQEKVENVQALFTAGVGYRF